MSEITHITCARCGKDNVIRNNERDIGTLQIISVPPNTHILLNCQHCAKTYPIVIVPNSHNPIS